MDSPTYFNPDGYTSLFQIILAFSVGVIFSPYSSGIFYLIVFILIFEIVYTYQNGATYNSVDEAFLRGGLILAAILGWLLGRTAVCGDWNPLRGNYDDADTILERVEKDNEYYNEFKENGNWED